MYNHEKQYRCTIIRGKSKSDMDNLLPVYAKTISEICPCKIEEFETRFNKSFERFLPVSERIKKTLDNHRTEISGKLFGMYYYSEDGMVYEGERTRKFLEDDDQPAFFKDICCKMQFPNGMQKIATTVSGRVRDKIRVRPYAFVVRLLKKANSNGVTINKKMLGYYVLNSLDVLQGNATPDEVLDVIKNDIDCGIERDIYVEGKASSYTHQHINELINYLELANLIRINDSKEIFLNPKENMVIDAIANQDYKSLDFDIYKYNVDDTESRKRLQYDWDEYYQKLSTNSSILETTVEALAFNENIRTADETLVSRNQNSVELGDEGEMLIYRYEKDRVSKYNPRLANKVLSLGKTKGLGYDIQSVIAEPGDMEEFVKYIEVKSTKRTTIPNEADSLWLDTLNMTRNEYIAAQQHGQFYSIYRVYFTTQGIKVFVLTDISKKLNEGTMKAIPATYRIDFSNTSIDRSMTLSNDGGSSYDI